MKCVLIKISLFAAFQPEALKSDLVAETLADAAAELLRHDGALTCAADYERVEVNVPDADADDTDALIERLTTQWPEDGLTVGALPPVHMLGRNGKFKKARLVREPGRLELWLGHDNERFPLLSIVTHTVKAR